MKHTAAAHVCWIRGDKTGFPRLCGYNLLYFACVCHHQSAWVPSRCKSPVYNEKI